MKMVKSLLLGSAAGLIAVAGAQAADLPVKAKPVEYVKVCSLYGEGFFYIPGTDTCIKIGGWVRAEYAFNAGNSHAPYLAGAGGFNNDVVTNDVNFRARWVTSLDVRTQTEYGTLRAYTRAGYNQTTGETGSGSIYVERAFIQFAGFTFGKTASFFDFFNGVFHYGGAYFGGVHASPSGINLAAYTMQFGNGISATISLEENYVNRTYVYDGTPGGSGVLNPGTPPGPYGPSLHAASPIGDYGKQQWPDLVAALRVDQAWGSAQIAGALHQVTTGWYGNNNVAANWGYQPDDKFGFAVMGGLVLNVPTGPGDKFHIEAAYAEGAMGYLNFSNMNGFIPTWVRFSGGVPGYGPTHMAAGWIADSVFDGTSPYSDQQQLTTGWTVNAAFEHYWTPALRTSIWGVYSSIDYNDTASEIMCYRGAFTNAYYGSGCNPDFNVWAVGLRTIWNPVKNLDIGLELMYAKIDQKNWEGVSYFYTGSTTTQAGANPTGYYLAKDQGVFSGLLRVQRNFWP